MADVKIENSWKDKLNSEFEQMYFESLIDKVKQEYTTNKVFPEPQNIFRAFDLVPFEKVKVVILGQDPYHTPGVADGLAFSTKPGNRVPPSLQNIYKEIVDEYNYQSYKYLSDPDLTRWANQGIFLLNNTLTVQSGKANSHSKYGWDTFTDAVIEILSKERSNLVFMLWGNFAKGKQTLIHGKHLVLESAHPSPFSARNGFFGNNHFKLCNQYLESKNIEPIQW